MPAEKDIREYHQSLDGADAETCDALYALVSKAIPKAEGKVWHGHPVWFIAGNPVVGYGTKKGGVELLFWSGQSFELAGLTAIGKFKAAGIKFASTAEIKAKVIKSWLKECVEIQWDYANLPKKRKLEKLTKF